MSSSSEGRPLHRRPNLRADQFRTSRASRRAPRQLRLSTINLIFFTVFAALWFVQGVQALTRSHPWGALWLAAGLGNVCLAVWALRIDRVEPWSAGGALTARLARGRIIFFGSWAFSFVLLTFVSVIADPSWGRGTIVLVTILLVSSLANLPVLRWAASTREPPLTIGADGIDIQVIRAPIGRLRWDEIDWAGIERPRFAPWGTRVVIYPRDPRAYADTLTARSARWLYRRSMRRNRARLGVPLGWLLVSERDVIAALDAFSGGRSDDDDQPLLGR